MSDEELPAPLPFAPRRRKLDEAADASLITEIYDQAHRVKSFDEVADLVLDLLERHDHGIETIVHVVAVAAVAAATVVANSTQGRALGMDKSVMAHNLAAWKFIDEFGGFDEGPKRLLQYRQMLYPAMEKNFQKTIDRNTMDWLMAQAKEALESGRELHPSVRFHLETVSLGIPPFNYNVTEE